MTIRRTVEVAVIAAFLALLATWFVMAKEYPPPIFQPSLILLL
jgi:hypothetical protein